VIFRHRVDICLGYIRIPINRSVYFQ
jgi:hypothetical protein